MCRGTHRNPPRARGSAGMAIMARVPGGGCPAGDYERRAGYFTTERAEDTEVTEGFWAVDRGVA